MKMRGAFLLVVVLAAGSGCNSGGGSATARASSPSPVTQSKTLPAPSPMNSEACAAMKGCTVSGSTFSFPDGNGGTITCSNGICGDDTSYNRGYHAGYSDGLRDGEDTASTKKTPPSRGSA
jgi:hypothetical protein